MELKNEIEENKIGGQKESEISVYGKGGADVQSVDAKKVSRNKDVALMDAQGTEFQVNSYTSNDQTNPSITSLEDGGFVVSWQSGEYIGDGQDGSDIGVYAQIYNTDGTKRGGEFQVNTFINNHQYYSSISSLKDGGFVVTWESDDFYDVNETQDGFGAGIYAQMYNTDGTKRGGEFQVHTYINGNQERPSISFLQDGGFVVTWSSDGQDGSRYGLYAQIYNVNGTKRGGEFQVNTYTDTHQVYHSITSLQGGGFVVTWEGWDIDPSGTGIYAQMYNADGTKKGGEFLVNTYTDSWQNKPSIASLQNGGFVVSWESYGQDGSDYGVYMQVYNENGTKIGSEFQANTYTDNYQGNHLVTGLHDGGFVVTWISDGQDGSGYGVYAQVYNVDRTKKGGEFLVTTYTTGYQGNPSIAGLNDGGFVVSWQSNGDGSDYGIFGQRFDQNGTKIELLQGVQTLSTTITPTVTPTATPTVTPTVIPPIFVNTEFRVNTYTDGYQVNPSITRLKDGGFVASWTSEGQDSSSLGVYAQMYNEDGTKKGGEFLVNTYTYNYQQYPSVIGLQDGGFVVAWDGFGQGNPSNDGVFAQTYNANGAKVGGEFQVNTNSDNYQGNPSIASLQNGGFVVSWESYNNDGSETGIFAQMYNAGGTPNGGEFQVNTYTNSDQWRPSITGLQDGGFVVSWQSEGQDGDVGGIFAQVYNENGIKRGSEFQVNTYTNSVQGNPSVTGLNDGRFVVSWHSFGQDGSGAGVYAQVCNEDGTKRGSEFQVNTYTDGGQGEPSVTSLNDGFAIAWYGIGQNSSSVDIYAQIYNDNATRRGEEFRVNTYTNDTQWHPSIVGLNDGGFVAAWEGEDQDGVEGFDIFGQRFNINGTKIGLPQGNGNDPSDKDNLGSQIGMAIGGTALLVGVGLAFAYKKSKWFNGQCRRLGRGIGSLFGYGKSDELKADSRGDKAGNLKTKNTPKEKAVELGGVVVGSPNPKTRVFGNDVPAPVQATVSNGLGQC
jgi:hypothetical protein